MGPCGRLGCGRGGKGAQPGRVVDGERERGLAGDLADVAGHPEPHRWPRGVALTANHKPVGNRVLWGSIRKPPSRSRNWGWQNWGWFFGCHETLVLPPFIRDVHLCLDGGEGLVDWERGWEREPLKWSFSKQLKGTTPPPPSN